MVQNHVPVQKEATSERPIAHAIEWSHLGRGKTSLGGLTGREPIPQDVSFCTFSSDPRCYPGGKRGLFHPMEQKFWF